LSSSWAAARPGQQDAHKAAGISGKSTHSGKLLPYADVKTENSRSLSGPDVAQPDSQAHRTRCARCCYRNPIPAHRVPRSPSPLKKNSSSPSVSPRSANPTDRTDYVSVTPTRTLRDRPTKLRPPTWIFPGAHLHDERPGSSAPAHSLVPAAASEIRRDLSPRCSLVQLRGLISGIELPRRAKVTGCLTESLRITPRRVRHGNAAAPPLGRFRIQPPNTGVTARP